MIRTFILLAAAMAAAGCQSPAWQNPYAMIGPATVPPPGIQPGAGQAQPLAAGAASSAKPPAVAGGTIRSEISATPRASGPQSIEEPIRIVEAAPATKTSRTKTVPPIVVAATPTSRSPAGPVPTSAVPAVKFNPSPPATSPPATSRTRGYLSPQPANQPAANPPKNRLSTPMPRHDAAVTPATFVETTTAASGQWKAR